MSNSNEEQIILKWKFNPPDFFEALYTSEEEDFKIEIDNGSINAKMSSFFYESQPDVRMEIYEKINDIFLGAQVVNFKPFSITNSTMHRFHSKGQKGTTIFLEPLVLNVNLSEFVDIKITDKNGNIVGNAKSDRIKSIKNITKLTIKFGRTDFIAASILKSFNNAVNDPANELVHLFEILESLRCRFENDKKIREDLDVSNNSIRDLHRLANDNCIKQGRHRGQNPSNLRSANSSEIRKARDIARKLIISYLEYLEGAT